MPVAFGMGDSRAPGKELIAQSPWVMHLKQHGPRQAGGRGVKPSVYALGHPHPTGNPLAMLTPPLHAPATASQGGAPRQGPGRGVSTGNHQ